jgi:hypothetical protein
MYRLAPMPIPYIQLALLARFDEVEDIIGGPKYTAINLLYFPG